MVVKLNVVWYSKTHERWRRLISHPGECSVSNSESCWVVRAAHPNNSSLHKEWGNLPFLLFHKALPHSWQATGFDGTDSLDLKGAISQVTPQSKQARSSSSEIPISRGIAEEIRDHQINITHRHCFVVRPWNLLSKQQAGWILDFCSSEMKTAELHVSLAKCFVTHLRDTVVNPDLAHLELFIPKCCTNISSATYANLL